MAGRQLAPQITEDNISELRDWAVRLEAAGSGDDIGAYFPMNIAFHDRIVEMTNNTILVEFYRRVVGRMHLLRRRSMLIPDGSEASRLEHRNIVATLESRNAAIAGETLRAHVENGYQRFLDITENH
jgi:DNA-binding GntR family transcriptional regulator